jgi:hypothetical protein
VLQLSLFLAVVWAAAEVVHPHVWVQVVAPEMFGDHPHRFPARSLQELTGQWVFSYLLAS